MKSEKRILWATVVRSRTRADVEEEDLTKAVPLVAEILLATLAIGVATHSGTSPRIKGTIDGRLHIS